MIPFYETPFARLRVICRSDLEFPVHLHNAVELVYVNAGLLNITIDDKPYDMPAGSLAIIFPNQVHGYYTEQGNISENLLISCETELLPEFSQYFYKSLPYNPILTHKGLHPDVLYALRRLEEDRNTEKDINIQKAFLHLVLGRTLPLLSMVDSDLNSSPDLVKQILNYIVHHFQEPLSLESLAKELGVSKFQISRVFSKILHISFNEYINRIRLDYAAKLIRTTDHTMTYICMEAGFENQHTFNRVFKQYYNITPSEFRAR